MTTTGILLAIAALFAWINHKWLKLPTTIGLMVLALALSLLVLGLQAVQPAWVEPLVTLVRGIDFNETVMQGMLGFLLFAGALHVDLSKLKEQTPLILCLASVGVLLSTALVGGALYVVAGLLGLELSWITCLLFGAMVAPTDPIAVLAITKQVGAPKTVEIQLAGESLFNDGVGVVVFLALMGFAGLGVHGGGHGDQADAAHPPEAIVHVAEASGIEPIDENVSTRPPEVAASANAHHTPAETPHAAAEHKVTDHTTTDDHDTATSWSDQAQAVGKLFALEAGGGIGLGLGLGVAMFLLLRKIDDYKTEVLITLAGAAGGYALASAIHVSGPLAMVVAGLLIGNTGRKLAMGPKTIQHLDTFWELVDEVLNAVLFVLIGLEVLILSLEGKALLAGLLMIPLGIAARGLTVSLGLGLTKPLAHQPRLPGSAAVLTWAGLRGGISIALALAHLSSLPPEQAHQGQTVLTMVYVVVAFSIVCQGLTVAPLLKKLGMVQPGGGSHASH